MDKEPTQMSYDCPAAACDLILSLPNALESFLLKWTSGMRQVGVLEHTTAKREDCVASFEGFLSPLIHFVKLGKLDQDFSSLLGNDQNWADFMLKEGRRHRARGINSGLFLIAFKPMVQALEEIILAAEAAGQAKLAALVLLRRYADASEVLVVQEMTALSEPEIQKRVDETNRLLTMEKCTLENVLASTSDLILIIDAEGLITRTNAAAEASLMQADLQGRFLGQVLKLEVADIQTLLQQYPLNLTHEIPLFNATAFFQLQLVPLQHVSLASSSYLVLLSDISLLVQQRNSLQQQVQDQSVELADTEKQYQLLFAAAGESILLLDHEMRVIQANHRSGELFGCALQQLSGRKCHEFCDIESAMVLQQAVQDLQQEQIWSGELTGRRCQGDFFPMAVTLNRVELDSGPLLQLLVRDITTQRALQERLVYEKNQLEEANIALRHVMKTVGQERQEMQRDLSQRIQSQLMPALEKSRRANAESARQGYLDILQSQLDAVASASDGRPQSGLLRLTPAEMKVCQFIQTGASTKEMADALNLSTETIQTHRKHIRKKLGLTRAVNLYCYLQELQLSD